MLKAGAAQVDITPDREVMLAGSFEIRRASVVLSPLYASALAVDDGERRFIFVSLDLLCISDEIASELRGRIAEKAGTIPSNIAVSCTHTHNAHGIFKCLPYLPVDEELAGLTKDRIVRAGVEAAENLTEARMGYARGLAAATFNRRCILANGKVWMSPGPKDPPVVGLEGPQDQEFQTVWFEKPNGTVTGVLANYSAHATLTFSLHKISSDFPGEIRKVIQGHLGNNVPVIYLQGACANTSPVNFFSTQEISRKEEMVAAVGKKVGGNVLKAISQSRECLVAEAALGHAAAVIDAPARHTGVEDPSLEDAREYIVEHRLDAIEKTSEPEMLKYYFANCVAQLEGARPFKNAYPVELSVYRMGKIVIVTNPAELFVEYQLEIKDMSPFNRTIVTELTNGYCGYVCTERALRAGSYEARLAFSSKLSAEAGRMIVEKTLDLLKSTG